MSTSKLLIKYDFSLYCHNAFGIDVNAYMYLPVTSLKILDALRKNLSILRLPYLVLGGGSNLILTQNFPGLVLHMYNRGIEILSEDSNAIYIRAAAGETWHELVMWTLDQGIPGIENLSFIPGSVGAAPVHNIGAYGVELKDFFHTLTAINMQSGKVFILDRDACDFTYRSSIFKHDLGKHAIILSITLALPKRWKPNASYIDLAKKLEDLKLYQPSAQDISNAVRTIRMQKLPDPAVIGNVGSFFKNPIISAERNISLLIQHPRLVSYKQNNGSYKLSAGWLIDQCGWKGKNLGTVGIYEKQALVLVNRGGATGKNALHLAQIVTNDVQEKFGIILELEPVIV